MNQLCWRCPERLGQTAGERPVGIVATPHNRLFINQILDDVASDLLVEWTQTSVEKDAAEGADMLASPVVMLDRPFLQGLAAHRARHHPGKKAFAIERRLFLVAHVGAEFFDEA